MEFSSKRSHKEHVKKERHSEQVNIQGGSTEPNQPKFGNLIPQTSSNTELGKFAVDVLGHYDDTMQTIQNGAQHMAILYGVDRSQPITPITSTASHNIFDNTMRERMGNTTAIERRDPVVAPAEGSNRSYSTFGDYHQRPSHKGGIERQHSPPYNGRGGSHGSKASNSSHTKPNHPLMTGLSSSKDSSRPRPPTNHIPSKHINKHKKSHHKQQHHYRTDTTDGVRDSRSPAHSLGSVGKSASFTVTSESTGRTSPSLSEKGITQSRVNLIKRSNSADTPLGGTPPTNAHQPSVGLPVHTGKTGHTSFDCYNTSLSSEKKKDKKMKKVKKEKEVFDANSYGSGVTGGHMTHSLDHVTLIDSKNVSKPTKLNVSSTNSIEDSTIDSVDLHSMLKEMHKEMESMPSFLTPIHTPSIKETPFFFGSNQASSKPSLQGIKEESSTADGSELRHSAVNTSLNRTMGSGTLLATPTPGKAIFHNDIIGSVSSSDESSGSSDDSSSESGDDSSSEDENDSKMEVSEDVNGGGGSRPGRSGETARQMPVPSRLNIVKEEVKTPAEDSTTFMLDQINQHYNHSIGNTLTPIKSSPMFPNLPFPLNDESANLSPAKPMRSLAPTVIPQPSLATSVASFDQASLNNSNIMRGNSVGFQPLSTNDNHNSATLTSGSDSSSSDEDSDSESSDSEDDTFNSHAPNITTALPTQSVGSYESIVKQESKPFHIEYEDISQDVDNPPTVAYEDNQSNCSSSSKSSGKASKKRQRGGVVTDSSKKSPRLESEPTSEVISHMTTSLLIQIPLSKVQSKAQKPQAKVVPFVNKKRTSSSTDSSVNEMPLPVRGQHTDPHRYRMEDHDGAYSNNRHQHHGDNGRGNKDRSEYEDRGYHHHHHSSSSSRAGSGVGDSDRSDQNDRSRSDRRDRYLRSTSPSHHMANRYGYGSNGGGGGSSRRDESRDRKQYPERSHGNSSEYYFERARSLKREADAITVNSTSKAIKYIQSIAFFMRHGFAQESESKWDGNTSVNNSTGVNKAYKIYSDTLKLLKYTMKLGTDCKPLIANCLRCHSVLLWKIYSLKQRSVTQYHKELLEVFNTSKLSQKSPNPSAASFSPLPSPASVGSTNSSCSGAGGGGVGTSGGGTGGTSSYHIQEQSMPISKGICNKVTEYLTFTGYIHQGLDLWRQAEIMSEQYREIFNSADRRVGRVNQFSPVTQIADWIDDSLQSISSKWQT